MSQMGEDLRTRADWVGVDHIVILLLLFGGGGGYYAFNTYGGVGLGGVFGMVFLVLVILWIVGALR
jgi:hypothetical protein